MAASHCPPICSDFGDLGKPCCDEAMTRFFLKVLTKPNDLDDCPTEITKVLTHPKGARILRCHNLDCKVSACSHAFWRRSIHCIDMLVIPKIGREVVPQVVTVTTKTKHSLA